MKWKLYPKCNDYEVSRTGKVRSLKQKKVRLLKTWINNKGYVCVTIYINKSKIHKLLSRMVLITWEGYSPDPQKKFALHKNNIKIDCSLKNLKWGTQSENEKQAFRDGIKSHQGENHPQSILKDRQVKMLREKYAYYPDYFKKHNNIFQYSFSPEEMIKFLGINPRTFQAAIEKRETFKHLN